MYDVIIIGRGPAGLSASLYTVRANLNTLIIGKEGSVLNKAEKIENYFGFSDAVSGRYLLEEGEKQALRLGVDIFDEEAVSIRNGDYFEVTTAKRNYTSKAVLLATGQPQKKVKVENLEEFEGRGVSYCSACDGFFYNNLKVGVLGSKDYAVHEALELQTYTKDITIFTNGEIPELSKEFIEASENFKINPRSISKIDGSDFLQRIYFNDGTSEEIDGIFVANESASSIDFARKLGILTEGSSILVDRFQQTNIEGLFAAGDCTGGFRQISTAVGQGALAGRKMIEYVKGLKKQ